MLRAHRAAVRSPRLPPAYLVPTPARPAAASAAEGREDSAPHAVLQQNGDPSARKASETARPGAGPGGQLAGEGGALGGVVRRERGGAGGVGKSRRDI